MNNYFQIFYYLNYSPKEIVCIFIFDEKNYNHLNYSCHKIHHLFVNEENFIFWFKIEKIESHTHQTHDTTLKNYQKHELKPPRV